MTTATPPAGLFARLRVAWASWVETGRARRQRPAAARTAPAPARAVGVEHVQIAAELAGLAAFTVAGFLVGVVLGFVVLGVVLLVAGNVRWS